jgi:hypothetical protein
MKNKLLLALFTASLSCAAGAADMYVRGGFNGWGTDNLLVAKGKGMYEARVTLSPGNHPFKVGSGDWSAEWTIAPASVTPGSSYRMVTTPGRESHLFVRKTADYTFSVDLRDPAAPMLSVARIDAPPSVTIDPHKGHRDRATLRFATFDRQRETVRFSSPDASAALRSYTQSTTLQLRDPGPQFVTYRESVARPTLRSGSLAFDALFALAGAEMAQNSVAQIKDGNYNDGKAIACACFETGEKWHYVWTRDLSYAADLGLAMLDPQRVVNSLDFKLSPLRTGIVKPLQLAGSDDGSQIIQDTGSGGSWPVSTDRVSWAFGAEKALEMLAPEQRGAFAARAFKALGNTIENDRVAAFDTASGLYTGEQSFLDWRDQSYAAWIVNDLASMASSKALSTNVAHYKALTLAATLAHEHGAGEQAARYAGWAAELKRAINQRLWLDDANMYSSLTAGHFDGAPMYKFDWLGQALAVVTGVADPERARKIMAAYPHGPMGAPVIYPQQQDVPVYHNRAIWPFVTAYGLKAAAISGNVSVADAAYDTLIRGAATNLSNMENLEWLSGQPLLLDEKNPALIGPVINSRRQLWSVGAYLGMVIEQVFGVAANADGITLKPFVTARLRREAFGKTDVMTLTGLPLRGQRVSVRIRLPQASRANGYYAVKAITLNGAPAEPTIPWAQLTDGSVIEITLGTLQAGAQQLRRVSADPYVQASSVFAPHDPAPPVVAADGAIHAGPVARDIAYQLYRDGKPSTATRAAPNACYTVEARFRSSGNRSHHSPAVCTGAVIDLAAPGMLPAPAVTVTEAGKYMLQVRYRNIANQINLGISGGVKWMTVKDQQGQVVASGVVQMPHTRRELAHAYSTPLAATLAAGSVTVHLSDFYNMSYLQANSTFSAAGGSSGVSNAVDIDGLRILRVN